ncbi:MAG: Tol-Pal system protein TolB [Rhodocyclaceae bacterium]|nr:Tol-Pal system protein TolB [Rhodocyclaceae bacterium]
MIDMFIRKILAALALTALCAAPVSAQLNIEVVGAGMQRISVAVPNFGGDESLGREIATTVRNDLNSSGLFKIINTDSLVAEENVSVDFNAWKSRGADALATATASRPGSQIEVRVRVADIIKRGALGNTVVTVPGNNPRLAGHKVADFIYQKLTGQPGYFSSRIAYVLKQGTGNNAQYQLVVADADGQNPVPVLKDKQPIISPAWSPDGTKLAYVSFGKNKPIIYEQTLKTGHQRPVASFRGSNSAPAYSPDGSRLVVALSREGGTQLYSINLASLQSTRITNTSGIDTEPAFSPDGQWLYFTSDRGGSPQIYRMPANGGSAQRISFDGNYNVTARPSPDGRTLAFITRRDGGFRVATLDLATRQVTVLTDSQRDESPTFAPNGQMILYATILGGRGVLAAVSADGQIRQKLSAVNGDAREPAWGPNR